MFPLRDICCWRHHTVVSVSHPIHQMNEFAFMSSTDYVEVRERLELQDIVAVLQRKRL